MRRTAPPVMEVEIVTVGTELLLGLTVDSNAAEIARALAPHGVRVSRRATVGDDRDAVRHAVADALARTRFVIVTGGLGPTSDDVTKLAVAELYGAPLELDAAVLAAVEQRFATLGSRAMPPANRSQAEVPRGAVVLPNRRGTAPGLWLEGAPGTAVLLPGVPHEMRGLLEDEVVPRLVGRLAATGRDATIQSLTLRTTGIAESALAERLGDAERALASVTLAYVPGPHGVDLRLTAWELPRQRAAHVLEDAARRLTPLLGRHYYGRDDADLAAVVLGQLRARGATLAVAESCTGGMISERITAVPGASDVFVGGIICYADAVKVRELGVSPADLAEHGAVSEPVVLALAAGAARKFATQAAIAVTGIAGPTGGTPAKPVGTVWLAAQLDGRPRAVNRRFAGDRGEVRARAAQAALDVLRLLATTGER